MTLFEKHIVILTICCLYLQLVKADDLKNYVSKTKNFPDNNLQLFFDDVGIYRTNLDYAVCTFSEDMNEANCQIKRLMNNQNPEKSCNISVIVQDTTEWIRWERMNVMNLNENKAILLWSETNNRTSTTYMKSTIVDFNNCHATYHQIAVDNQLGNIPVVVHNNNYDLLIANSESCGDKLCKLSFDFDGNRISEPSSWYSNATEESHILMLHPASNNGIISASYDLEHHRAEIALVQSNDVKVLKQFILKSRIPRDWIATFSTNYETIRMCTSANTTLTCQQFDLNGKLIAEHTTDIGYYLYNFAVQNLPDGGYVVMTSGCSEYRDILVCDEDKAHYNLTKFNANGTKVGALNIAQLNCLEISSYLGVKFFENETKEPCMSFTCSSVNYLSNMVQLDFTSKCFSDNEFTN